MYFAIPYLNIRDKISTRGRANADVARLYGFAKVDGEAEVSPSIRGENPAGERG